MSMNSQLTEQLGMVKVAGTLKQSTQVQTVQVLVNPTDSPLKVMSTVRVKLNLVLLRTCLMSIRVTPWTFLVRNSLQHNLHCVNSCDMV